ncbi:MAG: hypothetical protein EBU90_12905 [Proteobacteria bacterium]|nr:hypothetical protein [Pseudomonadota bacterium]NBP15865.1 hypothetical protein [bacterium]
MNKDRLLLEEVYLKKIKPNLSANHSETQVGNIPDGAIAPKDYRDEQQEEAPEVPAQLEQPKERAGKLIKIDKSDLDKSEVLVFGFGTVTLGQLKKNISDKFQDLSKRINNNEPVFVWKRIREKYGFLMHGVKALIEIEKDIEKLRRAGKMPGVLKRYNFNA